MSQQPVILLMDEDTETLEKLQTVLHRQGYQVMVAADARAALRLAKITTPDLIISDLLLTGMDGYKVWTEIRSAREFPNIPILVISALTVPPNNRAWRPTESAEWQILSYDAALPKPVDLRRCVRVVEKLLRPDQAGTIPGGPSAILAMEDHHLRESLAAILKNYDFGVETSDSIEPALQLARTMPPATLILDYRRPDESVKTTILQAERLAPNTPIIPIVDPEQEVDFDIQTLCEGLLTIPLHPTHTVTNLNRILELYDMRQRTQVLSTQVIVSNQHLLDTQQAFEAQNNELEHVNTKLRELDAQRETFTSMMVHDLKSPLGSILGTLNFLITDPVSNLSDFNQNLLNGAIAAGNQMLRLIETLLEGQRLASGNFQVYQEPFDISAVIDISLEQITPFVSLHDLGLEYISHEDLPLAFADATISQRILENLLDNAIKYSPANSAITIRAVPDGQFIKVSVEDLGPGIPKSQQADIFERVAQLKASGKPHARVGIGIGLNFCHLAAQALGGSIWVESEGQTGAIFVFTLPIYED